MVRLGVVCALLIACGAPQPVVGSSLRQSARPLPSQVLMSQLLARPDPALRATLHGSRFLELTETAPGDGLPAHVRAGSALRRWSRRLVIVQDDVNALALLDDTTGVVTALLLPPGAGGQRAFDGSPSAKALKMDLEACVTLDDGRLVAFGSGSTPNRESVVVVDEQRGVRIVDGRTFYAALRSATEFAGSELNIEGAVVLGSSLRLFQRGNGAPREGREPKNAFADIRIRDFLTWLEGGAAPKLEKVRSVSLGEAQGVSFGFTDAATLPDGRVAFLAGAEDSPDAVLDGEVVGARFGVIDGEEIGIVDILDEAGTPIRLKLEGIDWLGEQADGSWDFAVVADMDDPGAPSVVAKLRVTGGALRPAPSSR